MLIMLNHQVLGSQQKEQEREGSLFFSKIMRGQFDTSNAGTLPLIFPSFPSFPSTAAKKQNPPRITKHGIHRLIHTLLQQTCLTLFTRVFRTDAHIRHIKCVHNLFIRPLVCFLLFLSVSLLHCPSLSTSSCIHTPVRWFVFVRIRQPLSLSLSLFLPTCVLPFGMVGMTLASTILSRLTLWTLSSGETTARGSSAFPDRYVEL